MDRQIPRKLIAVIGRGECSAEEALIAEQVGALLAQKGVALICGGLGGTMEAACRGARKNGGVTIGILPGLSKRDANDFVDYAICSGMREGRNFTIVLSADGVIALPGEFGTLSEISFALKYGKPVVSLQSWNVSERIIQARTPEEAVERVLAEVDR